MAGPAASSCPGRTAHRCINLCRRGPFASLRPPRSKPLQPRAATKHPPRRSARSCLRLPFIRPALPKPVAPWCRQPRSCDPGCPSAHRPSTSAWPARVVSCRASGAAPTAVAAAARQCSGNHPSVPPPAVVWSPDGCWAATNPPFKPTLCILRCNDVNCSHAPVSFVAVSSQVRQAGWPSVPARCHSCL